MGGFLAYIVYDADVLRLVGKIERVVLLGTSI